MTKPKTDARGQTRREQMEWRHRLAAHPDTVSLFERAKEDPHVRAMEVKSYGIELVFFGIGPKVGHALLDALEKLRKAQKKGGRK
jgi:hypothetical protein